jgi:hypothetical protein
MISCWVDQSRDSRVSEHRDSRWGRRVIGVHVSHLNHQDLGSRDSLGLRDLHAD